MLGKFWRSAAASALLFASYSAASAQGYDPRSESPLTLLAAPKDPLAYFDAREQVRSLLAQRRPAEAEPLAEQITRDYPRDGENWLLLASAKWSLKKYTEAAAARERAGTLLFWGTGSWPAGRAASDHLRAGNKRAALDLLRRVAFGPGTRDRSGIYDNDDFATLRSDPEFLEIVGRSDYSGLSRNEGWRRDVDFLRDEVRRLNADYRDSPPPQDFQRRYEDLKRKVPQLSDEEIFVEMSRMLAVLRQGHTHLGLSGTSRLAPKTLPFQLWVFPEGLFIVDAVEENRQLVGSRLISIEGMPAEEVLRKVNETQSVDGDNQYLANGVQSLRMMPFLGGLGIAKSSDTVRVELQRPGGPRRTVALKTTMSNNPSVLGPPPGVQAPLFLRDARQFHWHQSLPDQDALYVQLNAVIDEQEESLSQYGLRLRELLAGSAPKNLILDMRHNRGGSTSIYAEFLRTMIGFSLLPERRLFVLIGRNTYSAAGNLITELEQLAGAVFVGEASSECCTLYGSPSGFTMPFSKVTGSLSTRQGSVSRKVNDFRRELNPHVPVMLTAKDYFAGQDPVLETVFRMIKRN